MLTSDYKEISTETLEIGLADVIIKGLLPLHRPLRC